MTRAFATASLLFCLSSVLAAQLVSPPPPPPAAQSDTPPDKSAPLSGPATFSISGIVVSATTGTPLDRAEVSLSTSGPRGSQLAQSLTTENGSFRFDHLQAGKYRLDATRRGYIAAGYQDHDGFVTAIVTGRNLSSDGIRLALLPTAIIGGVVTDDSGEPVGGAQVHLFRLDQYTGEGKIVGAGQDTAEWPSAALGELEAAGLLRRLPGGRYARRDPLPRAIGRRGD